MSDCKSMLPSAIPRVERPAGSYAGRVFKAGDVGFLRFACSELPFGKRPLSRHSARLPSVTKHC